MDGKRNIGIYWIAQDNLAVTPENRARSLTRDIEQI